VLLVTIVPPTIIWSGLGGTPDAVMQTGVVHWPGLALLLAATSLGAWLVFKTGIPNACLLGAMSVSGTLTGFGIELSAVPFPIVAGGQVLLGAMLGTMFDRAFLKRAGSFTLVAVAINLVLMVLCTALAWGLSRWTLIPFPTMELAIAPGGVAEMGVTAKILHLDVAMVVAFHVFRIFTVVSAAPFVFDGLTWLARTARRTHPEGGD
jgi:membrane AbrB-like protein